MTIHEATLSRRSLLKAGAGLAIGVYIAGGSKAFAQAAPAASDVNIAPNTFLIINADNTVTVLDCTPLVRHGNYCDRLSWRMTYARQNDVQNVSDGL